MTIADVEISVAASIDRRERLDAEEFHASYVALRRPVLIKRALHGSSALTRWTLPNLSRSSGHRRVLLKEWGGDEIRTLDMTLRDYISSLECYEDQLRTGGSTRPRPAYLHDVPLVSVLPDAPIDLETFPADYFPPWYRQNWWAFAQLFLGPSNSVTPLHFDCLLTHNLFFQVRGVKKFIIVAKERLGFCYPHHWRWCGVDAGQPDFAQHPLYAHAEPVDVIVEPGDALYLPPGTLHHVKSLDCALSFNIDWHTRDSALFGAAAVIQGMPIKNAYYNLIVALGMWSGIPARRLFPLYASYLNYIS